MRLRTLLPTILALLIPLSGAQAQDIANNSRFGDWVLSCEAVTVTQNQCQLLQVLTDSATDQLIVRFVAVPGPEGTTVLLAQVPIGVYLPGGAVFRPEGDDDVAQTEMIWQRCLGNICEAAVGLSQDDLQRFTDRGAILFGYRRQLDGDPIVVRADVSRFAEAMALITPAADE